MKSLVPKADIMKISGEELELLTGKERWKKGPGPCWSRGVSWWWSPWAPRVAGPLRPASPWRSPPMTPSEGHHRLWRSASSGALLAKVILSGKRPDQLSPEELGDFLDFANAAGSTCATKTGAIPPCPPRRRLRACRKACSAPRVKRKTPDVERAKRPVTPGKGTGFFFTRFRAQGRGTLFDGRALRLLLPGFQILLHPVAGAGLYLAVDFADIAPTTPRHSICRPPSSQMEQTMAVQPVTAQPAK